jgi:hypothetical protein
MLAISAADSSTAERVHLKVEWWLASPITLGEPVALEVLMTNLMSQGITFSPGANFNSNFHFVISAPDGKQIDLPPNRTRIGLYSGRFIYLEPGQTYTQRLILNELYAFDSVGTYSISATWEIPTKNGETKAEFLPILANDGLDADERQVKSKILDLKVSPRDESMLRKRCAVLLLKVQESGEENLRAASFAEELSYIKDPVAIPYLKKLVKLKQERSALAGLMRIGSDEATAAMIEVAKSEFDENSASYARELLLKKFPEIRDPNIREKVRKAIEREIK